MNKIIKFGILFSVLLLGAVLVYFLYPSESNVWKDTKKTNTLGAFELFVELYPNGEHKTEAVEIVDSIRGSFTDSRNNREYKTVKIGQQEWMAENLAYLPEVGPHENNCGYWVYDVQDTSVLAAINTINYEKFGVLYNYKAALKACPDGWHLPNDAEWDTLGSTVNRMVGPYWRNSDDWPELGWHLKAYHSWDVSQRDFGGSGSDDFGFEGIPTGIRLPRRYERSVHNPKADPVLVDSKFDGKGKSANFWSSTESSNKNAWYRWLSSNYNDFGKNRNGKDYGFSVRCVKDK